MDTMAVAETSAVCQFRHLRKNVANKWRCSIALAVLSLTGCAYIPQKPLVEGATTAAPSAATAPVPNGAIFQVVQPVYYGYQPLFEDRRPRNIGDTLTITLQENVSASKNSSANASRNGKNTFSAALTPRFLKGLIGGDKTDLDMEAENTFGGKGGANANNTFRGTITVTVDQLLANGNLHVLVKSRLLSIRERSLSVFPVWLTRGQLMLITQSVPIRSLMPVLNMWGMAISMKRRTWGGYSVSSSMSRHFNRGWL